MRSSLSPSRTRGSDATAHGGGADLGGNDDDGGGGGGGGGDLVKVAHVPNDAEAQMIQGLLSEHGIPSLVKGAFGFSDSQFPGIGPRDVFVTADAAQRARQVLEGIVGAR